MNTTPAINEDKKTIVTKKRFPFALQMWLWLALFINLVILFKDPKFSTGVDSLMLTQIGFIFCLIALRYYQKWGFWGLLIIYVISLPINYSGGVNIDYLLLPIAWIPITYFILKVLKIEENSIWNQLGQAKNQNQASITHPNITNKKPLPYQYKIIVYLIITLSIILNITLFVPMHDFPSFSFIQIIGAHPLPTCIAITLWTAISIIGVISKKSWGIISLGFILTITMILSSMPSGIRFIYALIPAIPSFAIYLYCRIRKVDLMKNLK
ncbi:MAG: hypothetical protein A3E82_04530 [Gammaproteobacteria bacterium RIFCSPHIGHO2_12_FULL_38_11]|nr:MAG: hypothetical protein A3E82_04530 [Gammaproteobacteria bacterium RIFCSPHIGHO2_12_FULL_38_11]